ncbi:MAG: hypothetical protein EA353_08955 [Puniceicoccaceae bacterium]|nr:MAG: hypothetical protein EA353_08955 [Puniceicoccaceae bacterium]
MMKLSPFRPGNHTKLLFAALLILGAHLSSGFEQSSYAVFKLVPDSKDEASIVADGRLAISESIFRPADAAAASPSLASQPTSAFQLDLTGSQFGSSGSAFDTSLNDLPLQSPAPIKTLDLDLGISEVDSSH